MLSQPPEDKEKVSMPSLWRAKLLMAQKDRVAEGLQVGSPVLVSFFFGLAVSKYQSGEGTKKPFQKPFVCEPREPREPRGPRVQALDYGLASSFEKLRAQRQPMIQEISEQLGVAQMACILLKLGRHSNARRSQGSKKNARRKKSSNRYTRPELLVFGCV